MTYQSHACLPPFGNLDDLPTDTRGALEAAACAGKYPSVLAYLVDLHSRSSTKIATPNIDPTINAQAVSPYEPVIKTNLGSLFEGDSLALMRQQMTDASVDLIMTSPPYGLTTQKKYGNAAADNYVEWFRPFAEQFVRILKPNGSLVIDIGGVWKTGLPVRSLYHFDLLLLLCREYGFHLAQEFYWWNPARLPTPAEWVTIRRIRVKDAVDSVWWLSRTPYPRASNRRVLQPYTKRMERLFREGYNSGRRPSGHDISPQSFSRNNGGAIPSNLIALANTESNTTYNSYCQENGLPLHPARFPTGLPAFFIRMLTDRGDMVFDPFAGSAITGVVAETLGRRWECCEVQSEYVAGSRGRFIQNVNGTWRAGPLPSSETTSYEVSAPASLNSAPLSDDAAGTEEIPLSPDGGMRRAKPITG